MVLEGSADVVARMILSLIASHGEWDLADPDAVHGLVHHHLLAGILTES